MDTAFSLRVYLKRYWVALLIALLVIVGLVGYGTGLRIVAGPRIVRVATLTVNNLPAGTTVYADQTRGGVARKGGPVSLILAPGNHSILVDAPYAYPWSDIVPVSGDASVTPILVPKKPVQSVYSQTDEPKAEALLKQPMLPTADAPLSMGCAHVYVDGNRVIADAATTTPGCTAPAYLCAGGSCTGTVVFSPVATLTSVIPYPGRQDALIVAYGDMVAVLELDPRAPQYFAPIYKGTAPLVAGWDNRSIAVKDAGRIFDILL